MSRNYGRPISATNRRVAPLGFNEFFHETGAAGWKVSSMAGRGGISIERGNAFISAEFGTEGFINARKKVAHQLVASTTDLDEARAWLTEAVSA